MYLHLVTFELAAVYELPITQYAAVFFETCQKLICHSVG